jgi:O-antigen/teichoic acid export membrane protein
MNLARRTVGMLPAGTLQVGTGLAVLGMGSYAHLALAGHTLSTNAMAAMSVLWATVFWLGIGLFFPVEQELIRMVATRVVEGEGIAGVVRRGAVAAACILLVALTLLAVAARPLADHLFGGDIAMVGALAGALAALAVVSVSRGVLAGLGRFTAYGSQLAIDGGLRIVLAAALAATGTRSAVAFGLILTAAPLLSALFTSRPLIRGLHAGRAGDWRTLCRDLGLLMASTLLAQLVVNIAVINVKLLAPGNPVVVGALLSAMVLARIPLFIFASLQASLLPGLSGAIAAGDRARFRRLLIRGAAVVTALGLAGGVPAVVIGPWLAQVVFATRPVLGPADFAWLAAGTLFYMLALVLGQGALALSRHRDQLLAWTAGAAVLVLVTVLPGGVMVRVETAYAFSSLTVTLVLVVALVVRMNSLRGISALPTTDPPVAAAHPGGGK